MLFLHGDLVRGRMFVTRAQSATDVASRSWLLGRAQHAHDAVVRRLLVASVNEDDRVHFELGLASLARAIDEAS